MPVFLATVECRAQFSPQNPSAYFKWPGISPQEQKEEENKVPVHSDLKKQGLTVVFRYQGGNWTCEKVIQKPPFVFEPRSALLLEDVPPWCAVSEPPEELITGLADLFSYNVDFLTEVSDGDRLSVYIQKNTSSSTVNKPDPILAARISISGKDHLAFYYEIKDGNAGYFDQIGKSLKKSFLKSPLNYRRITSRFSAARLHPILKKYRPHFGIEYAAPPGTPVSAIGDGKITFIGHKKGLGAM